MPELDILQEVNNLAEAMNKFGPIVVILAVFLLLFLVLVMFLLKNYTSTQKQMMDQQQQLIDSLINKNEKAEVATRVNDEGYDEKNIVGIFYKLNTYIKSECKKFLDKTDCDRIGVYVFHNGTVASHGLPFFKVSCICECIRRGSGIASHIADSTNVPLTLFDDIINELYTGGSVVIRNNVEGACHSDSFFLNKDKVYTALFTVVYDSEDNTMAFILGEYRAELDDAEIERDFVIYKDLCARLKPVLEFSEYRKVQNE